MNKNKTPKSAADKASLRRKLSYGAYATAVTAVFVAVIIGLNIVASVLAEKFPLQWDVTANKDYSISEENEAYIKGVTREVKITLCATESDYTGGNYLSLLQSNNYTDKSGGLYFNQTVSLLKDYAKLNDRVEFVFADPQDPSFSAYTEKYPNESFSMGDILVESTFTLDGKQISRHKLLGLFDLYDITNYGSYYIIAGSKVETAVTSAIYSATADKTYKVAVITANGGKRVDNLEALMTQNNYEFTEISDLISQDIPEDTDLVIIAAPSKDYTEAQLKILDDFLDIRGELGKTLMYVAADDYGELPNLYDFLAEWGYDLGEGTVKETTEGYYLSTSDTTIMAFDQGTDYSAAISGGNYTYVAADNVPITPKWEENENYSTTTVLATSETAESGDKPGEYVTIGVATYLLPSTEAYYTSNVIVLSTLDLIDSQFNSFPDVGNLKIVMSTVNEAMGRQADEISFDVRTYQAQSFVADAAAAGVMTAIFVVVIPLVLLAVCIVVCVRRRRL